MNIDMQTVAFIVTIILLATSIVVIGKFANSELSENVSEHNS